MHIDNFTLLVCLSTAAILQASAFLGAWLAQRAVRAPLYFSAAFFAGTLSCVLFLLPPHRAAWFLFLNTVVGDTFVCVFLLLLQVGVRSYLGITRHRRVIWLPLLAAAVGLYCFTEIRDSMFARIMVLGLIGFVVRVQIGYDLAVSRKRSSRLLAAVMFVFALVSLWQVVGTIFRGAPTDYFHYDLVQSSVLFLYVIFAFATGILLFLLNNDELVRRLEEEAATDFLTGTFNRRGIERVLSAEIERARRSLDPFSVALLDIDSFKDINDKQGHEAGDEVIQEVVRRAAGNIRPYDSMGRLGGDEFVVILPGTDSDNACIVADRIRESVANALGGVTISVGVATATRDDGLQEVLRRADEALYVAKHSGRNCVFATRNSHAGSSLENLSSPRASI